MFILIPSHYTFWATLVYVVRALKKGGHRIIILGPDNQGEEFKKCDYFVDIKEVVEKLNPFLDMILSIETHHGKRMFSPYGFEKLRIPKIWWAIDNH